MVLGSIVILASLTSPQVGTPQRVPEDPVVSGRVLNFLATAAAIVADGQTPEQITRGPGALFQDGDNSDEFMFSGPDGIVFVLKSSGNIVQASLRPQEPEDWNQARQLSTVQLVDIGRRLCLEARFASQISLWKISRHSTHPTFELWVVPVVDGVRYANRHAAHLELNYRTGRMWWGSFRPVPIPPNSLFPNLNAAAARVTMITRLAASKGVSMLVEEAACELVIWRPQALGIFPEDNFLTETYAQLARANRGILVYRASFADAESFSESRNDYSTRFHCFVDARTGDLLNIDHMFPAGGTGVKTVAPAVSNFSWNWSADRVQVVAGNRSATVSNASIKRVDSSVTDLGAKVILIRGSNSYCARFHKNGLLSIQLNRKRLLGKPAGPLSKALQAVTGATRKH